MADPIITSPEAAQAASSTFNHSMSIFHLWAKVYLLPIVIFFTAFVAWRIQIIVFAKRAAYDYITNHEFDHEWRILSTKALEHLASGSSNDWDRLASSWAKTNLSEGKDLQIVEETLSYLNRREFLCTCLLDGSIDQDIYASWWGIPLIREWKRAESFVLALRSTEKGDKYLFCNFEKLANSDSFRKASNWDEVNP
ncbi:MAG: DUF4760 domain-containing protein [Gammaproteobacteria bacterium]|nr:DUF4760 domain-containing protein [Gammaproteobacteria bacterium]MYG66303.1 DUF4760 domain-containing protein [Gammaproteobacteria bacterium]